MHPPAPLLCLYSMHVLTVHDRQSIICNNETEYELDRWGDTPSYDHLHRTARDLAHPPSGCKSRTRPQSETTVQSAWLCPVEGLVWGCLWACIRRSGWDTADQEADIKCCPTSYVLRCASPRTTRLSDIQNIRLQLVLHPAGSISCGPSMFTKHARPANGMAVNDHFPRGYQATGCGKVDC